MADFDFDTEAYSYKFVVELDDTADTNYKLAADSSKLAEAMVQLPLLAGLAAGNNTLAEVLPWSLALVEPAADSNKLAEVLMQLLVSAECMLEQLLEVGNYSMTALFAGVHCFHNEGQ